MAIRVTVVLAAIAAAVLATAAQTRSTTTAPRAEKAAKPPNHHAPFSPTLHPNGPKETCPEGVLPLPADAIARAVETALSETPRLFPKMNLAGLRADSAIARRSGHVRYECGSRVEARTVTVGLRFPAYAPSASLQQHTVLVARFSDKYKVWYVLR